MGFFWHLFVVMCSLNKQMFTETAKPLPNRDFKRKALVSLLWLACLLLKHCFVFLLVSAALFFLFFFFFTTTLFVLSGWKPVSDCPCWCLIDLTLCFNVTPYKETLNWVYLNRSAWDRAQWRPCRVQLSSDKIRVKVRKSPRWDFFFLTGWPVWHLPAIAPPVAKLLCLCVALTSVLRVKLHVGMRCSVSSAVLLSPKLWTHHLMNLGALNLFYVIAYLWFYSKFSLKWNLIIE